MFQPVFPGTTKSSAASSSDRSSAASKFWELVENVLGLSYWSWRTSADAGVPIASAAGTSAAADKPLSVFFIRALLASADRKANGEVPGPNRSGPRALADHAAGASRVSSPYAADRAVPGADSRAGRGKPEADDPGDDAAHRWRRRARRRRRRWWGRRRWWRGWRGWRWRR